MLTDRQERFCQEYLIDLNATQAYIRAGYSARTAHNCASRLMAKAGVRTRIDELMAVRSRRTGVTQERVVRELARIAFVDPTQAIDFECEGACAGVAGQAPRHVYGEGGAERRAGADCG